jgi:hypothetical protein
MPTIITQAYLKELFDYAAANLIWKKSRPKVSLGAIAGSRPNEQNPYSAVKIDGRLYKTHRLIYLWCYGTLPDFVDHLNGDKTDNRIENLRAATKSENCRNRKTPTSNTSGIKNVSWSKHHKKWRVYLGIESSQHKHIGYFDDLELAELVAIEAREKFHADFARHC